MRVNNFTIYKWDQIIVQFAHFQDLMINKQEMTENEQKISFMTVNDWSNVFSFAIHEKLVGDKIF